jgi:hypothetical protein
MGPVAITPFADFGFGWMLTPAKPKEDDRWGDSSGFSPNMGLGASLRGSLMFTTKAIPGLYLQMSYQRNFFPEEFFGTTFRHNNLVYIGLGYAFVDG